MNEHENVNHKAEPWWEELKARVTNSVWTALFGKTMAYLAGFAALALIGSGHALHLLPRESSSKQMSLLHGSTLPTLPSEAHPTPSQESTDAGADESDMDGGLNPTHDGGSGITTDGKVVLNVATEQELQRLPGIGPSKAKAIVALRAKLKGFRKIDDLLRIKGIGRKSLKRIRHLILLNPESVNQQPSVNPQ